MSIKVRIKRRCFRNSLIKIERDKRTTKGEKKKKMKKEQNIESFSVFTRRKIIVAHVVDGNAIWDE